MQVYNKAEFYDAETLMVVLFAFGCIRKILTSFLTFGLAWYQNLSPCLYQIPAIVTLVHHNIPIVLHFSKQTYLDSLKLWE